MNVKNKYSGRVYNVELVLAQYANNHNLYLGLRNYADITTNLGMYVPPYYGFVDTNNFPEAESFIEENNLGKAVGFYGTSGFCQYPLYEFNKDLLKKMFPVECKDYECSIDTDDLLD